MIPRKKQQMLRISSIRANQCEVVEIHGSSKDNQSESSALGFLMCYLSLKASQLLFMVSYPRIRFVKSARAYDRLYSAQPEIAL